VVMWCMVRKLRAMLQSPQRLIKTVRYI